VLILAAYDNHPDTVDKLMAAGANACAADHNGNTALMGVIYKGQLDIARTLLQTHCDANATNNAGETALAFAALFGRFRPDRTWRGLGS
jgi:ankyrin repeat protein